MNEELLKRLDALAAKLGVTVDRLWNILLGQARVEAIVSFFWLAFALGLGAASVFFVRRGLKRFSDDSADESVSAYGLIGSIAGVIGLILFMCSIIALTNELNPPYWALKQLLLTK